MCSGQLQVVCCNQGKVKEGASGVEPGGHLVLRRLTAIALRLGTFESAAVSTAVSFHLANSPWRSSPKMRLR